MVKTTVVDEPTELTYSKQVIVGYYTHYSDFLNVVLDADTVYTIKEIELILKEVQ